MENTTAEEVSLGIGPRLSTTNRAGTSPTLTLKRLRAADSKQIIKPSRVPLPVIEWLRIHGITYAGECIIRVAPRLVRREDVDVGGSGPRRWSRVPFLVSSQEPLRLYGRRMSQDVALGLSGRPPHPGEDLALCTALLYLCVSRGVVLWSATELLLTKRTIGIHRPDNAETLYRTMVFNTVHKRK